MVIFFTGKGIKLIAISIVILFIFSFVLPQLAEARSGCCSWHGGVCGCRCCDGTSLSAKCAPYYPSCSSSISKNSGGVKGTSTEKESSNWIWWTLGILVIGIIAYNIGKRNSEK